MKTEPEYHDKAEPMLMESLRQIEAMPPSEMKHVALAAVTNQVGILHFYRQRHSAGLPYLRRSLELCSTRPMQAMVTHNLALLLGRTGQFEEAEKLFTQALALHEGDAMQAVTQGSLASVLHQLGQFDRAEALYRIALNTGERLVGMHHPAVATGYRCLAALHLDKGDQGAALHCAVRAAEAEDELLGIILSFTSERQRLAYQETVDPYGLLATLGSARDVAQLVLRRKGIVLESLMEDVEIARSSGNTEMVKRLKARQQALFQALMQPSRDTTAEGLKQYQARLSRLRSDVEKMEGELARTTSSLGVRRALKVTVSDVQKALQRAGDPVLIEYIKYRHYLKKDRWEDRYGAVLMAPSGEPKFVPLGPAASLETLVALYRNAVRRPPSDSSMRRCLEALYDALWSPISAELPRSTRVVFISPDSALHFVSMATLMDAEGRFLAEKLRLYYVASGRDLLRASKSTSDGTMVLVGHPDFSPRSAPVSSVPPPSGQALRDLRSLNFALLPGTRLECQALSDIATRAGWSTLMMLDASATESALRKLQHPRILHIATHGFFLSDGAPTGRPTDLNRLSQPLGPNSQASHPDVGLRNPMHRGGLALAGAQGTVQAWIRGEIPDSEDDGILLASEVAQLDLRDTWMVVLSACDTGTGQARSGEGVLGLKRGFIQAGVQNLLLTLWPVSDNDTADIMQAFYKQAQSASNVANAMGDVQLDFMLRLRRERGLANAVQIAGPFIMNVQGSQTLYQDAVPSP